jgi:CHAT domain-containing protein/tetratricopeptide (TPR) repeat protein
MCLLLRTLAFFCFLVTVPTLVPYAQTLKELESQIQQAIKLNDYRKANSLIDGAIAKTKPGDRSNGNLLAAKGDVALRQKSYRAAIEWAEKAEKVLDKYPPDLISITNLINLGYAYLKSTDEDEQGMSMIYFEKVEKLLPKLPVSSDCIQIGNRLMSIGNELIKPANSSRITRICAAGIFTTAGSAFEKGKDPVLAAVAQRQSFALAGGLLQEDEENDDDDDDDDDEKAQKVKAKQVGKPIAKKNAKAERVKVIFEQGAGMASTTGKTGSSTGSDVDLGKKLSGLTPAQQASVYREAGHSYLFEKKNYAKAESHLLQAISLMKQSGQLSGISPIWCYSDLALLYALTGKYEKVPVYVKEAQKIIRDFNQRWFQFLSMSEETNEVLADMGEIRMAMGLTVLMQKQKPGLSIPQMHQLSYDVALYQNGLYMDRMRNVRTLIREKGTAKIRQLEKDLFIQKQLIANAPVSERKASLKGKGIEEDLNEEFLELSNIVTSTPEISWAQIKGRLKPDQAAVSFVRFGSYASSTGTINDTLYAAMIIRSASAAPDFVTLGSQRQLLQVLAASKTATGFYGRGGIVASENTVKSGESIYNLVWKPIEQQLKGVTQIYFSVEGVLNQIAFAAIPFPGTTAKTAFKDRYVGGRYKLNQLFSTRQLVQGIQPFRLSAGMSSALFGDVNYESGPSNGSAKKAGNSKTGLNYVQTLLQKDQKRPFDRLEATRQEVADINRLLPISKSITGADASKSRLLQFSGHSPTLLHVATHAVYVRPGAKRLDNTIDEALMRTALVLSGANQLWKPQSRFADDGLLTAYEISNQDFTQTRLVVLSACETALGDVRGTEGVFGLQRAFRMAGVEKLILSLWRVEDVATQQFMSLFYNNLKKNQEIREAFTNAQMAMQKQADKPNQWAAFVLLE